MLRGPFAILRVRYKDRSPQDDEGWGKFCNWVKPSWSRPAPLSNSHHFAVREISTASPALNKLFLRKKTYGLRVHCRTFLSGCMRIIVYQGLLIAQENRLNRPLEMITNALRVLLFQCFYVCAAVLLSDINDKIPIISATGRTPKKNLAS